MMRLATTSARSAKGVCYSKRNARDSPSIDEKLDDISVASTLKQSNVTIQRHTMNRVDSTISESIDEATTLLNNFLDRFDEDRATAERLLNELVASSASSQREHCKTELIKLHVEKFGINDPAECIDAIMNAYHLNIMRQSLPREIEQRNSPDVESSVGMSTSSNENNSSTAMSLDTSNVVMGSPSST